MRTLHELVTDQPERDPSLLRILLVRCLLVAAGVEGLAAIVRRLAG